MRSLCAFVIACGVCCVVLAARNAADFTEERFFRFGMSLADADAVLRDEDNWQVAYRIDTPSTADIACAWQEDVIYMVRFYQGRCYAMEKRTEVDFDEVERVFRFFDEKLGETPEATQSSELELLFSRWTLEDREISVTAYAYEGQSYMLTYEELDPLVVGEARHAQEQELESAPAAADPITGGPRRVGEGDAGENGDDSGTREEQDGNGEEDEESEDPTPPPDPDDDDWWE